MLKQVRNRKVTAVAYSEQVCAHHINWFSILVDPDSPVQRGDRTELSKAGGPPKPKKRPRFLTRPDSGHDIGAPGMDIDDVRTKSSSPMADTKRTQSIKILPWIAALFQTAQPRRPGIEESVNRMDKEGFPTPSLPQGLM